MLPGGCGAGQHRARPTQLGYLQSATAAFLPEEVDNLEVPFAEIDSALEQGRQAMRWGTDEMAKKLQVAGAKVVKLVKVRRNATRLLKPQPQLHAADAPWRLTLVRRESEIFTMDWENWSLQSGQ